MITLAWLAQVTAPLHPPGLNFEPTISVGNILSLIAILITLLGLHSANRSRLDRMETKLDTVWEWWLEYTRRRSEANGRRRRSTDERD